MSCERFYVRKKNKKHRKTINFTTFEYFDKFTRLLKVGNKVYKTCQQV